MSGADTTLRDGDIYSWRWKDDARDADRAPYRSYHCRSQIAVARNGRLYDTFWSGHDMANSLRLDDVILTLRGNASEMTVISEYKIPYYRYDDIVDTRHSNNSRAPIYLKVGAVRDAGVMREHANYLREQAQSKIQTAERALERATEAIAQIEKGDLDAVSF